MNLGQLVTYFVARLLVESQTYMSHVTRTSALRSRPRPDEARAFYRQNNLWATLIVQQLLEASAHGGGTFYAERERVVARIIEAWNAILATPRESRPREYFIYQDLYGLGTSGYRTVVGFPLLEVDVPRGLSSTSAWHHTPYIASKAFISNSRIDGDARPYAVYISRFSTADGIFRPTVTHYVCSPTIDVPSDINGHNMTPFGGRANSPGPAGLPFFHSGRLLFMPEDGFCAGDTMIDHLTSAGFIHEAILEFERGVLNPDSLKARRAVATPRWEGCHSVVTRLFHRVAPATSLLELLHANPVRLQRILFMSGELTTDAPAPSEPGVPQAAPPVVPPTDATNQAQEPRLPLPDPPITYDVTHVEAAPPEPSLNDLLGEAADDEADDGHDDEDEADDGEGDEDEDAPIAPAGVSLIFHRGQEQNFPEGYCHACSRVRHLLMPNAIYVQNDGSRTEGRRETFMGGICTECATRMYGSLDNVGRSQIQLANIIRERLDNGYGVPGLIEGIAVADLHPLTIPGISDISFAGCTLVFDLTMVNRDVAPEDPPAPEATPANGEAAESIPVEAPAPALVLSTDTIRVLTESITNAFRTVIREELVNVRNPLTAGNRIHHVETGRVPASGHGPLRGSDAGQGNREDTPNGLTDGVVAGVAASPVPDRAPAPAAEVRAQPGLRAFPEGYRGGFLG